MPTRWIRCKTFIQNGLAYFCQDSKQRRNFERSNIRSVFDCKSVFGRVFANLFVLISLRSTHSDQGGFWKTVNLRRSGCSRIKCRHAIHQKQVLMMAMRQRRFDEPPSILPTPHGECVWTPLVEIPNQTHRFGVRFCVIKMHRLGHVVCRIRRPGRPFRNCVQDDIHFWVSLICCSLFCERPAGSGFHGFPSAAQRLIETNEVLGHGLVTLNQRVLSLV